jgi:hypothetical protein
MTSSGSPIASSRLDADRSVIVVTQVSRRILVDERDFMLKPITDQRRRAIHFILNMFFLAFGRFAFADTPAAPINLETARQQFKAAQEICTADGGKFWGVSLCGPIMFVEPESRRVVANQKDEGGVLREEDGVYVGLLPASENVSSTPTQWSGVLWSQIIWPLSDDPDRRNTLLAHELFHRIQSRVAVPVQKEAANEQLDTLDGRYLMQLEWRALAAALKCTTDLSCRQAVTDALVFRAARYHLFPSAAAEEKALELNEGVAEYTGVSLGIKTPQARVDAALFDLSVHVADKTFVRSFAYATGPAYGLLLDKYMPEWRQQLAASPSLGDLLQQAARITLPRTVSVAAAERALQYDGTALRRVEMERERNRQQVLAANRAKFVDGPVLVIPLHHSNIQFDPRSLQPLEKLGTVYPTMRIAADWGVLEVRNGALLNPEWNAVTLTAPANTGETLKGDGWTLDLKPNWKVIPGNRGGDLTLAGPTQ